MRYPRSILRAIRQLASDQSGVAMIETALVAPILAMFALGTFDVSGMIARQHELQAGATDVEGIVLAVSGGTATDTSTIKSVLASSLSLPSNNITVTKMYRCGTDATLVDATSKCTSQTNISTYVKVDLTDTYTPTWSKFGVGKALTFNITRTVQVS
ncbi:MAG: pilus assembly protein [Betaproteobacteria bacterium]|nr:pilus assembly protein [Betaproteobacteria bacterium]